MAAPIVTLTTDFGTVDPYVGVMKGVILGVNPRVSIVDISHEVPPQAIKAGAFVIGTSHRYFPQGTVHVVVVDPGVGTSRRPVLLATPSANFLAPDNGILGHVLWQGFGEKDPLVLEGSQVSLPQGYRAYHINNPDYWVHPLSTTFHGRDIFAPAAAHLSLGLEARQLGPEVNHLTWLAGWQPQREGNTLMGEVVYIDHFGNLVTNVPARCMPKDGPISVEIRGRRIKGLNSSYAEGNGLLAIVGSHGNLELSLKNGSAAQRLRAQVGDPVQVSPGDQLLAD